VTDDLNTTFGSGNFTVISVSSAAFTENAGYNGDTDINLLSGTDTLAIDGHGAINVVVTARILQGEVYTNTADGSGDPPGDPPVHDDGTASGPEFADPLLTKASDISQAAIGDSVTYTITVTNNGNEDAEDVTVTDTLPSNLQLDSANSTKGTTTLTPPRTVTVDIGTIAPGEIITIKIDATIISGSPSTITNTAHLTTSTTTDNPLNNTGSTSITIPTSLLPQTGFAPGRLSSLGEQSADRAYYAPGDMKLVIPSLNVNIPVVGVPKVSGTWDVSWLWNSAGYLNGSAFPTTAGNSVLTGHVYLPTGLPGPFVNIGSLMWGDQIIVNYAGQQYVYSVRTVQILAPDDVNTVMKHQDSPWITLVTCRSYDEKTDSYRLRVAVSAVLIAAR
jgi:LPXTG-site transpeptidase (sortase) family protein